MFQELFQREREGEKGRERETRREGERKLVPFLWPVTRVLIEF